MLTPSIKTLRARLHLDADKAKTVKAILTATRAELEALPAGAARVAECYHSPKTSDVRMHCLDAALDTYGVEAFQTRTGEWVEYLNNGDTYTDTIVRYRGNYSVASWGDIAERHGAE
jgi:hypothetical protein